MNSRILKRAALILFGFALGWFTVMATALLVAITGANVYLLIGVPLSLLALSIIAYGFSRAMKEKTVTHARHAKAR